jgi:hypothetical protein
MTDIHKRKSIPDTISNEQIVPKEIRGIDAMTTVDAGTAFTDEHGREASIRIAHASPDAPAVDVYVNDSAVIEELEFRQVTDYLEIPAAEYTVAVNVAETNTTVFGPVNVELAAEDYTAVALGEVMSTDTGFTVSVYEDTNGATTSDGDARIRAIHASPDAPPIDVTVKNGAVTLFNGFSFGESSDYTIVSAGEHKIEIRLTSSEKIVFKAVLTLDEGGTYTVFAEGYSTGEHDSEAEPLGLVQTLDGSALSCGRKQSEKIERTDDNQPDEAGGRRGHDQDD